MRIEPQNRTLRVGQGRPGMGSGGNDCGSVLPVKKPTRPVVRSQPCSFWTEAPREGFTRQAEAHFEDYPSHESLAGITVAAITWERS